MALDYLVPLLDGTGRPILNGSLTYILIPSDQPWSGSFRGGGGTGRGLAEPEYISPRRKPVDTDPIERRPLVRRRGVPAVYTKKAEQIERNNKIAAEIVRLLVEALNREP